MTEVIKTLIFAGVAVVVSLAATFVTWPRATEQSDSRAGLPLFESFTDPLGASSMKIVTFDEETGQLSTFEVRKDRETEQWTIPSRDGYPADALEQMKNAANAFVGLKILDIQTDKAEDHDDLGVAEPKLEDLSVGDEGVGRLVNFKNGDQETMASLIIGDALKDDPSQRFVRIPGQDPVYVVRLDDSPLTTSFRDWIDNDLLQLSSIDLSNLEILDYNASLALGGQITLTRNYTAAVGIEGTEWKLNSLKEYDPSRPGSAPVMADLSSLAPLNKAKLDELKTALDDLKIADVLRKPDGMSGSLRANQSLLTDKDAVSSLAQRGFYPVPSGPNGEVEILSANGELDVALNNGVKYVMRFGNISGVEDGAAETEAGVNRYLLVTTMVDESQFPAPELRAVPKTVEEMKAILAPPANTPPVGEVQTNPTVDGEAKADSNPTDTKVEGESTPPSQPGPEPTSKPDPAGDTQKPESASEPETTTKTDEPNDKDTAESADDSKTAEPAETASDIPSGDTEVTGSGEASGKGQAQQDGDPVKAEDPPADSEQAADATAESADTDTQKADNDDPASEAKADDASTSESDADGTSPSADKIPPAPPADDEALTNEELLEMLEAEQEKAIKENQRLMDERKDRLEAAERRVRDLNARFADWYYVIPEETYSKLRFKRDELFEQPEAAAPTLPPSPINGLPQFNFPGAPGN